MASSSPGTQHGLDGLQRAVEPHCHRIGLENALEAALRANDLGALEVGRLDMVRGFLGSGGQDAPPAETAFTKAELGLRVSRQMRALRASAICSRSATSTCTVLVDWLTGCYTAPTLDEALAKRADLQAGGTGYVPTRPCGDRARRD